MPAAKTAKPCVFCAIIRGEQQADIVAAEPHFVAFLDSHPLFLGHVLLVPRQHVVTLADLPESEVPAFFVGVQRMVRAA